MNDNTGLPIVILDGVQQQPVKFPDEHTSIKDNVFNQSTVQLEYTAAPIEVYGLGCFEVFIDPGNKDIDPLLVRLYVGNGSTVELNSETFCHMIQEHIRERNDNHTPLSSSNGAFARVVIIGSQVSNCGFFGHNTICNATVSNSAVVGSVIINEENVHPPYNSLNLGCARIYESELSPNGWIQNSSIHNSSIDIPAKKNEEEWIPAYQLNMTTMEDSVIETKDGVCAEAFIFSSRLAEVHIRFAVKLQLYSQKLSNITVAGNSFHLWDRLCIFQINLSKLSLWVWWNGQGTANQWSVCADLGITFMVSDMSDLDFSEHLDNMLRISEEPNIESGRRYILDAIESRGALLEELRIYEEQRNSTVP